jgi:hypothetical protein
MPITAEIAKTVQVGHLLNAWSPVEVVMKSAFASGQQTSDPGSPSKVKQTQAVLAIGRAPPGSHLREGIASGSCHGDGLVRVCEDPDQ